MFVHEIYFVDKCQAISREIGCHIILQVNLNRLFAYILILTLLADT